jgi:hypothetical protein
MGRQTCFLLPRQTGPAGFLMFWLDERIYDLLRSITHMPWRVRREPGPRYIWRVGPGAPLAACQVPKWRARARTNPKGVAMASRRPPFQAEMLEVLSLCVPGLAPIGSDGDVYGSGCHNEEFCSRMTLIFEPKPEHWEASKSAIFDQPWKQLGAAVILLSL